MPPHLRRQTSPVFTTFYVIYPRGGTGQESGFAWRILYVWAAEFLLRRKAAALSALALRGPIHKTLHLRAIFPSQMEEFAGVEVGRLRAKKCLKAPAQVRAFPRIQAIPSGNLPV